MTAESAQGGQPTLSERIDRLLQIRCDSPEAYSLLDYEQIADDVLALLSHPDFLSQGTAKPDAVLQHIFALYAGRWHVSGRRIIPAVEGVLARLVAEPEANLDPMCVAYDLLFFLYWCWSSSIRDQAGFSDNVVRPFANAVRADAGRSQDASSTPVLVGYLAQFITPSPGNAMAFTTEGVLKALCSDRSRYRPVLYAWMFHDDATVEKFEREGILVRRIAGNSPSERIAAVESAIRHDRPEVLITDMNTALPTVIFERRVAPIQVLYQFGMPFWPIENLDGVFQVWQTDSRQVGFSTKETFLLPLATTPEGLAPAIDASSIAAERARFPGGRLIGTYGRLAKITPEFLTAVASAIAQVPDVTVVLGGTGDGAPIRRTLETLGVANRFIVVDEYVDGRIWRQMLDIFLDTFPQQGGLSFREVMAAGKPVVSMFSEDMPNFSAEKVPYLVARRLEDYTVILQRLLSDPAFYRRAREDTDRLVRSAPTEADYAAALLRAIGTLRRRRNGPLRTAVAAGKDAWRRLRSAGRA